MLANHHVHNIQDASSVATAAIIIATFRIIGQDLSKPEALVIAPLAFVASVAMYCQQMLMRPNSMRRNTLGAVHAMVAGASVAFTAAAAATMFMRNVEGNSAQPAPFSF
jgi:hypothetical protein